MKKEFSKSLVDSFIAILFLHLALSIIAVIFCDGGALVLSLFEACIPVYVTVFGGYYGKAAVENTKKIDAAKTGGIKSHG